MHTGISLKMLYCKFNSSRFFSLLYDSGRFLNSFLDKIKLRSCVKLHKEAGITDINAKEIYRLLKDYHSSIDYGIN